MTSVQVEQMKMGTESLVERARQGDQNAMGMIVEVRKASERGNPQAAQSLALIKQYIAANPIGGVPSSPTVDSQSSLPGITDCYAAAVVLAQGPILSKGKVNQVASKFNGSRKAFGFGYENVSKPRKVSKTFSQLPKPQCQAMISGLTIGIARALQGIRLGKLPISTLFPMAGWELGE